MIPRIEKTELNGQSVVYRPVDQHGSWFSDLNIDKLSQIIRGSGLNFQHYIWAEESFTGTFTGIFYRRYQTTENW